MPHFEAMIRKLRNNTNLDADDIEAIRALPVYIKQLPANTAIVREGDKPSQSCLMIDGYSVRAKTANEGRRQILSIHIAGDIPDLQSLHLHVMDHDVTTLCRCKVAFIPHDALRSLCRERPAVAEALWRETLVDAAVFREWIVNVGRRPAPQRLAHLISELRERLRLVGLSTDDEFQLPMTQLDLADALGLTPVHVNRVLQVLRKDGLLEFRRQVVSLSDADRLMRLGDFDSLYLHQNPAT